MSFIRHLYYELKPHLPTSLRVAFRRMLARHTLSRRTNSWPVNHACGLKPDQWPGWPDGKEFALVLTHDVETSEGLDKCRKLAKLELDHGFYSSFNFIPEGTYSDCATTVSWLRSKGFEVGVHDLRHDGKLYRSKREFEQAAVNINSYLKQWQAKGFRSGFMHHNLEWLHALDISYDMSTFDTDPFEPQPDGVNTIFPFWVHPALALSSSRPGYVELPYTLAQDFTLFVLLQEKSINLWKTKLDWIAEMGGMALLNTHPDYMAFDGTQHKYQYPAKYYENFLSWVSSHYEGRYWAALPEEVASYMVSTRRIESGFASLQPAQNSGSP
jgi:hypothetical protein